MFTLPDLPYDYKALEPYIDEETMHIHHDKHHATYINNLNEALKEQPELLAMDVNKLLEDLNSVPKDLQTKVKNNGGGHANHSLFWKVMGPKQEEEPTGKLADALKSNFGSFSVFQEKFSDTALKHFGSGWAWLSLDGRELKIEESDNQDSPLSQGKIPLLGLDVWEHAYYLKYQNRRAEYIKAWWNVVNWKEVEDNFASSVK